MEAERRSILRRIERVKRDLLDLERTRRIKRQQRRRTGVPVIALVGYTNAGKSTLLKHLTDAGVLIQNQLFSTLDPTTRKLSLPHDRTVLITDTVGFVQKLPHQLVEAFRSTLEEVKEANLLLHVVDASRDVERQIAAVQQVLTEIGTLEIPAVIALNKSDLLSDEDMERLQGRHKDAVLISAHKGYGIEALLERLDAELSRLKVEVTLDIPFDRGDLVARVHDEGEVLKESYSERGTHLVARVRREALAELGDFMAAPVE